MPNFREELLIHQLFEQQTLQTPNAIAVIFKDQQLTYRELNEKANQVAHYLKTFNVGSQTLVGVCLERSPLMLIALLAILKAGGAYVPLDHTHPQERLRLVMEDAQMPLLLTQSALLPYDPQPHQTQFICLDLQQDIIAQHNTNNLVSEVDSQNLAYLMYTSGSTGKPKGVQIVHHSVVNFLQSMKHCPGLTQHDRLLAVTTITFDISVLELFLPLSVGACVVIATRQMTTDATQLSMALEQYCVSFMQATPATWQLLLQSGWQGNKQLKILCGGESLPRELANQLLKKCGSLWNMYGPTETTIWSTCDQVHPGNSPIAIGRPIANTQTYLLDQQLQPVAEGEIGELYIGGAGLAVGYLNRPELTAERFIKNPFSALITDRIYQTGDLARRLSDGNLECLGRIDHQVKIRGFRIELGEIESLLWQHPDVESAVVVAREDVPGNQRLVGYITSNLIPERIPYQSTVFVETVPVACPGAYGNYSLKLTTDISRNGIGLVGVPPSWKPGQSVSVHLTLPGTSVPCKLQGEVAWCHSQQAGIEFILSPEEEIVLIASVESLLHTQGLLKMLQRSLVKNLREYLQQRLPDYMVPASFVILDAFALNSNGKVDRNALPAPEQFGLSTSHEPVESRTAIEQKLTELWAEILNLEGVSIDDNFYSLGGHSLLAIGLIGQINQKFEIELPLSSFLENPTIAGVAAVIEAKQQSDLESTTPVTLDLERAGILDPAIIPNPVATETIPNIFLTGTTGFLGVYLLYELLQQTQAELYCLVRAETLEAGRAKIQATLKHYQLWEDRFDVRIIPVLGDLSQSQFSLKPEQFDRLAQKIDVIYHCGAWVNILYPYSVLEATNVIGTQEVLRLASQTKIKPVHFISTVDVFASDKELRISTVGEQDTIGLGQQLYSGYAQSKYVAEHLVMSAHQRGIPVAIYRPSNITAASKTGINQTNGFITKMIEGCMQMGWAPKLEAALNLVPVDYASQAIIHLSQTQPPQGKAFHIVNPQPLMWKELVQSINQLGYSLDWVSYQAWHDQLRHQMTHATSKNPLIPLVTLFNNRNFIQKSLGAFYFKCDRVLDGLKNTAISCPGVDENLLMTYLSGLRNNSLCNDFHSNLPQYTQQTISKVIAVP
ncbi:MAG: amino acid adenylation domain-containing protein [Microcoleaceae cyanobacterium]